MAFVAPADHIPYLKKIADLQSKLDSLSLRYQTVQKQLELAARQTTGVPPEFFREVVSNMSHELQESKEQQSTVKRSQQILSEHMQRLSHQHQASLNAKVELERRHQQELTRHVRQLAKVQEQLVQERQLRERIQHHLSKVTNDLVQLKVERDLQALDEQVVQRLSELTSLWQQQQAKIAEVE